MRTLRLLATLLLLCASFGAAHGYSTSGSSGGYSRPGASSYAPSRRPSTSGGYAVPGGGGFGGNVGGSLRGGDQAISRQSASQSLESYRRSQAPPPQPSYGSSPYGSTNYGGDSYSRRPSYDRSGPAYAPPLGYPSQLNRSFGGLDGFVVGALLGSLGSPGHTAWFHDNQDSADYRSWRVEADRAAQSDPVLRGQLSELDGRLAQVQDQPRKPAPLPADVTTPVQTPGGGGGLTVILVVVLAAAALAALWWLRRRGTAAGVSATAAPTTIKGSGTTRFRVGQTFPYDPSPFLLAAGSTKIRPPSAGGSVSAEAVGLVQDGAVSLNRLYVGGDSFFQLHLGADGRPDECRYFSRLDEITPANQEEWGAWLDPAQGMIGWPEFQTKDGKLYHRVWAPGSTRAEPRETTETRQDLRGTTSRKVQSMLYGAETGAAAPAPQTEYVLVSAIQADSAAWVEVDVGIDVNPATLTLPAVAL